MSYFAPYIDATGLHLPTYEDRLSDLCDAYRTIFGPEAALAPAVPDYQLLSVFAKALDDVSALVLQAYNSRNPMYASGAALDLLLPQYGIARAAGEPDASVRSRIRHALAARGSGSADALLAAVLSADKVREAKVYINETDAADDKGIPPHSIAVVTRGGAANAVAQAIWDKKAPGIGVWGSSSGTATDAAGGTHTVPFTRYSDVFADVFLFVKRLPGCDDAAVEAAVVPAILSYIDSLGIAAPLNVPQLYGVAYAANPAIAQTFVITDIQVTVWGASSVTRDIVPCAWNEKITALADGGVTVMFGN